MDALAKPLCLNKMSMWSSRFLSDRTNLSFLVALGPNGKTGKIGKTTLKIVERS